MSKFSALLHSFQVMLDVLTYKNTKERPLVHRLKSELNYYVF